MLKLLKHDIRDSFLEVVILNGALLLSSVIMFLGLVGNLFFLFGLGSLIWGVLLMAIGFVILRVIIKSFHSKLFTNVGYLTLTTPVSIDKVLISKIIVSMLWSLVTIVCVLASYLILFGAFEILIDYGFMGEFFVNALRMMFVENFLITIEVSIAVLTSILASIVMLLFVLTLVNTGRMKAFKFLKAIAIFIGLTIIMYIFMYVFSSVIARILIDRLWIFAINIFNMLWTVGFYLLSRLLIVKRLELE